MESKNITVYSRTGCPYCDRIKTVLSGRGLNFREYKLGEHFDRESFYQQFGNGATFPQVVLNGQNLGGCSESVTYLRQNAII